MAEAGTSPALYIGRPIVGGTATRVLYIDSNGRVAQSAALTYTASTGTLSATRAGLGGFTAYLTADANDIVCMKRGTNPQDFRVYNTDDGAGNAEWLDVGWGANAAMFRTSQSGTGSPRGVTIGTDGRHHIIFHTWATVRWVIDSDFGIFYPESDGATDIGGLSGGDLTITRRVRSIYMTSTIQIDSNSGAQTVRIGPFPGAATFGAMWFGAGTDNASWSVAGEGTNTYLNAPTGGSILARIGNAAAWSIDPNKTLFPAGTLATGMTTGFLNIPGAAGAPSGAPANTTGFPVYWDSTNLKLYVYTGGAWKSSAAFT